MHIKKLAKNFNILSALLIAITLLASQSSLICSEHPGKQTGWVGYVKRTLLRPAQQPGLENPDGRCALNSLFHSLSYALSSYKTAAVEQKSLTAAYLQDLHNYQHHQKPTYQLTALAEWWAQRGEIRSTHKLFAQFAREWNTENTHRKNPRLLHIRLESPQVSFHRGIFRNEVHINGNASLSEDIAILPQEERRTLAEDPPDVLILSSRFQQLLLRQAYNLTPPVCDLREKKLPYEFSHSLVIEGTIYELVGVYGSQHRFNDRDGHATSLVKKDDTSWIYLNNNHTKTIPQSVVSRAARKYSKEESHYESDFKAPMVFIYKKQSSGPTRS